MKIASVADVKARFSSFLRESKEGPVIVTRNGKPVGVLLPMGGKHRGSHLHMSDFPSMDGATHKKVGHDFPGETFRVLKEKEEKKYGEYRTRRLVLKAWDINKPSLPWVLLINKV